MVLLGPVIASRTQRLPVKSKPCARVRYSFPLTVTTGFQVPFEPSVESAEISTR